MESLRVDGYAIVDGHFSDSALERLDDALERATATYYSDHGGFARLHSLGEADTIRVPFALEPELLDIATNENVNNLVCALVGEYFVLSQQNGVINPARGREYAQGAWHRDLPYQHVVFSRPIAINALCGRC